MGVTVWDEPANVETLRAMWADGKSSSEIAKAIGGGVSRNSVLGKAHRLGLGTHPNAPANGNDKPKTKGARPKSARPRPSRFAWSTRPKNLTIVHAKPAPVVKPVEVLPGPQDILPGSRMVSLMGLTETKCRWPYGSPANAPLRYCGADCAATQSYCPTHRRLAYSPRAMVVKPERRVA